MTSKVRNARIVKLSAMKPEFDVMIEKLRISRYFVSPQTDLHIAPNAWYIDNADT